MAGGPANGWAGGILIAVATDVPINRTAAMPIGVIGLVRPCAKLKHINTRRPGWWVRASGYSVVIGPRLGQPEAARGVERPFGVLRRPVEPLYPLAKINKLQHLRVVKAGFGALAGQIMMLGAAARPAGDHHPLVAQPAGDNPVGRRSSQRNGPG